jgi:hypothetical protein
LLKNNWSINQVILQRIKMTTLKITVTAKLGECPKTTHYLDEKKASFSDINFAMAGITSCWHSGLASLGSEEEKFYRGDATVTITTAEWIAEWVENYDCTYSDCRTAEDRIYFLVAAAEYVNKKFAETYPERDEVSTHSF